MQRAVFAAAWAAICVTLWLTLASLVFLWLAGGLLVYPPLQRPYQWARYAPYFGRNFWESAYLTIGALLASMPFIAAARFQLARVGGWRAVRQGQLGMDKIRRGTSLNHSDADWMTAAEQAELFPSDPDEELGGVVVGELDRVDLGPVAKVPFNPEKPETWGNGGRAPLLIDPQKASSPHSMIIGGPGSGKSQALITTLLNWRKSFYCLDPSEELHDQVGDELRHRRKQVVQLVIGGAGPNVLDAI